MQVKRFKAADMRRALEMVRTDLGDDAVILSNANHGNYVEVLATADDCSTWLATNTKEQENKSVFAKYEAEPDQDALALLSDLDLEANNHHQRIDDSKQQAGSDLPRSTQSQSTLTSIAGRTSSESVSNNISDNSSRQKAYKKSYLSEQLDKLEREKVENSKLRFKQAKTNTSTRHSVAEDDSINSAQETINFSENSFFKKLMQENVRGIQPDQTDTLDSIETKAEAFEAKPIEAKQPTPKVTTVESSEYRQEIKSLQSELSDMRELLEQQLVESQQLRLKGSQIVVDRRLSALGFDSGFRAEIHRNIESPSDNNTQTYWRPVLGYLAKKINTLPYDLITTGGRLAFIGPTGAGKTTTIAKLATRYVLEFGRESIAIVTTDNERLGSQSQLKSLANILQIPMRTVEEPSELVDVLASLDPYRLVLIDTPGVNIRDIDSNSWFNTLNNLNSISKLFVTATNVQGGFQSKLMSIAREANSRAIVLTKLDECLSLGESIKAVIHSEIPVAYLSNGQNIPSDIHLAKANKLLEIAVKLGQSKLAVETESELPNSGLKFKASLGA
ncbi:hypothetical protein [Sessilibacter corallicola]|uniref:flagellar biosynthesis protein FlhF n=1 Tax=Sessilibacter corallicola TaxID=2904075 RepID=UPI001E4D42A7|nr:hypothetical protein [Sessilibacter corallicola]MCE2029133.1 hypothetical protein [Sessilibacter corallicola]